MKQNAVKPAEKRIKVGGYSSDVLHAKRDRKRREAQQRQSYWNTLNLQEKLNLIDQRRGSSAREWERLTGDQIKFGVDERDRFNLKPWKPRLNA